MEESSAIRILAIPNLQGERFTVEIEHSQIDWVSIEDSIQLQLKAITKEYNDHEILIGSSFGALAAWMFTTKHCPSNLKGIVLVDALPSIDSFPKWKLLGLYTNSFLPNRIRLSIYNFYRLASGNSVTQDITSILSRIESIIEHFPEQKFPIPTIVLSSN